MTHRPGVVLMTTETQDGYSEALFSRLRGRRGQSLILALMVMFLLVFIAGLFIALVARNVRRAQRSGEVLSAEYLAEAGVRYANDQLAFSADGADWRPAPSYPDTITKPPSPLLPSERDPDYLWLSQGFSRYSYGKGRFLIKVTYEPRPDDPVSKFVKIQSIGRMGEVDPNDPTTFRLNQPLRARRERVAYKALAITDFARFITNKDRRPGGLALGTPGFPIQYGENGPTGAHGGSIRVNGDLLWHGRNLIWLDPLRGEGVEVAGDIRHEIYSEDTPPAEPTEVRVNDRLVVPSSSNDFTTLPITANGDPIQIGCYRDGRMDADKDDYPRSVFRIEPPIMEMRGPGSNVGRYRQLTRNSGVWKQAVDPDGRQWWFNTGYYGWGEGIYINNNDDIQRETSIYTVRGDWMNPGASEYWQGPYYTPPAVNIILTPYDLDNNGAPDMILIHSGGPGGSKYNWYDEDGNLLTDVGEYMIMPYPSNGVVFAEGNIRIKGVLPPGVQLTVVSGANIYVDGNILRHRDDNGVPDPAGAVSLLASDNVCVNTTQFFGPVRGIFVPGSEGTEEPHFEVTPGSQGTFWLDFAFGDSLAKYDNAPNPPPISLYVRHTSDKDVAGPSLFNMLVNFPSTNPGGDPGWPSLYRFGGDPTDPGSYAYVVDQVKQPIWEHAVFDLRTSSGLFGNYDLREAPGVFNRIGFQFDEAVADPVLTKVNYLLSRVAVQPCDIQIEALMYAQNGSFFVLPGEWFNPDENDTEMNLAGFGARPPSVVDPRWPFHGQPLDVQIVVRGAISENLPAFVSDVRAWMDKWGWIPPEQGSSGNAVQWRDPLDPNNPSDTRQLGLKLVYDTSFAFPRLDPLDPASTPIRADAFGRLLPITPKLPMSSQLLYFGEPG